jgi:hypothetical protein
VDLELTPKSTIVLSARRTRLDFDSDEVFLGSILRDVLNRDVTSVEGALRYAVTPVTTMVVRADTSRERFRLSPSRDADSIRIAPGVEFDGLIRGRASAGYQRMRFQDAAVPDYAGLVADTAITYTFFGITRATVGVNRDVAFSFELEEPYYLQTGATVTVTQRLFSGWDIVGHAARQRLAYRELGRSLASSGRVDVVTMLGGGIGYRIGGDVRVGLDIHQQRRRTPVDARNYRGLLIGSSVTYGF